MIIGNNSILHFNHSPVIFVSGRECITIGIDFFNETIMKTTIPLNKFISSYYPTKSPLWYCTGFCKYISLIIKTQSLDTVCFSRSNFATFSEPTSPDFNIFKTTRAMVVLSELYHNIHGNRIKIMENLGQPWGL